MDFEFILKQMHEQMQQMHDDRRNKMIVGIVDRKILREFAAYVREKGRLQEEVDLRKRQMLFEMEKQIEAEFHDRIKVAEETHYAVWQNIYDYLHIDPDGEYSLEEGTGRVHQYLPNDDSQFPFQQSM